MSRKSGQALPNFASVNFNLREMNVSILLVWVAVTAIGVDFAIYLFSHKYRKYGGHIIGVMAYLILLADLTYSLYRGECGTDEFRQLLAGTLIVGACFAIEYTVSSYRHIRQHEKGLALKLIESSLEDEVKRLRSTVKKLTEENEKMMESFQRQVERQCEAAEQRNLRIIANEEFEETLDDEKRVDDTREAFQLYTLLIHGYECERGPKFERKLHNLCEKICTLLKEKEIKLLLQIDAANSRKAGEFYDAT